MKLSTQRSRVMLLSAALGVVLFIYIIRLMQLQIVQGEEYYAMVNRGTERSQVVEAARGEIDPRSGGYRGGVCPQGKGPGCLHHWGAPHQGPEAGLPG